MESPKPLNGRNPEAPQTASGKLLHFRGKGLSARNGGHFAVRVACIGAFPNIRGTLFGVLITRILLFRVLYSGPLFSETTIKNYRVWFRAWGF